MNKLRVKAIVVVFRIYSLSLSQVIFGDMTDYSDVEGQGPSPRERSEGCAEEVDPNKLIAKDGVLGFEHATGFEQVTNLSIEVGGYVGNGEGHVIGYILQVVMAVMDPFHNESTTGTAR